MTEPQDSNPRCPDYGSHGQNAQDAWSDRTGREPVDHEDFGEIDALALAEYRECEGHTSNDTLMRCMKANTADQRCRKDYGHAGAHDFPREPTTYSDLFDAAPAAQEAADATGVSHHVREERATGQLVVQPTSPVDGSRFLTVWGPAEPSIDAHLAHARYLGADAALAAASWVEISSESDARSILDDVEPAVLDNYPEPNLSGEMAGESIPEIFCDFDDPWDSELHEAWEEGRDAVWGDALQATALRVLGDIARACEVESANEATVAELRKAAGL